MQRTILLIFSIILLSCNGGDSFYSYYAQEDLYRIPLIEPYQLINLYGIEEDQAKSWQIEFHFGGDKDVPGYNNEGLTNGGQASVLATEINVSKGIIYGYDPGDNDYPPVWFVIIPKEKIEKVFKNKKQDWESFLEEKGIESIHLYSVWELFKQFKKTYTLPWYEPKKNIWPDSSNNNDKL